MSKIGIISTSANPLHAGHLAMAEWDLLMCSSVFK